MSNSSASSFQQEDIEAIFLANGSDTVVYEISYSLISQLVAHTLTTPLCPVVHREMYNKIIQLRQITWF